MIWRIPFQFCPSCNWTRILIFKYSLVSIIRAPLSSSFSLCIQVLNDYRPIYLSGSNIDPPFELLSRFSTRAPLNYTGLKFENLDGCESRGVSLSLSLSLSNPLTFDTNRWNRNTATRFSRLLSILDFCPRPTFSTIQLSNDNSSLLFPFKRSFLRVYW